MEICPKCGLPQQACVCEQIAKDAQRINITNDKKRYGKITTLVNGFDNSVDLKQITKALKNKLACGGTFKDRTIELQGQHRERVKKALVEFGFDENSIN